MDDILRLQQENAQLRADLRRTKQRLELHVHEAEMLRNFGREMANSEELAYIVDFALAWLLQNAPADHGLMARWLPEKSQFLVMGSKGLPLGVEFNTDDEVEIPTALTPSSDHSDREQVQFSEDKRIITADIRRPDGTLMGVVLLQRDPDFMTFSVTDEDFLNHCTERLALAIYHAVLFNKVEALSQYRSQLFRMLSHDLRQPLTVLMGYIQLVQLQMKLGNMDAIPEYIESINKGAKDLAALLEEVLLKEQVDNASREDWIIISMREQVLAALDKQQSLATLKHQDFQVSITEDSCHVKGMALQLKEAASNLISNAIKYTPEEGHVEVKLRVTDDHQKIYFEVVDAGYGISEERQERLFEVFYRAQEPGTENIKGTGLGLSLVKGIVENHDGEVYFSSERGKGSIFGFWLPLTVQEDTPE